MKVFIDTDMGVDDARALFLTLRGLGVCVLGVSVVAGNISVEQAVINASRVRRAAGNDVPIFKGCQGPLVPPHPDARPSTWVGHGTDGLGGKPNIDPKLEPQDFLVFDPRESAASALVRIVNQHKGDITLICIGPLTNVALALKLDSKFGENLKNLVIMGGNLWGVGNARNHSTAEYNFHADPEAAHIVLEEIRSPITIVPWEIFDMTPLTENSSTDLKIGTHLNFDTLESKFLNAITEKSRNWLASKDIESWFCDEIAVCVALDRDVVLESKKVYASVELAGSKTRGQVAVDWYAHMHKEELKSKNLIEFVTNYNISKIERALCEAVSRQF